MLQNQSHDRSFPYGEAKVSGILKQSPEDFFVEEVLGFEPLGEGEHLLLQIRKRLLTTEELINLVARDFGLKARDIGVSGLKDKVAVTTQWLSLYLPGASANFNFPEVTDYQVIQYGWHNRKLRRGTHIANRFNVVLRGVELSPTNSILAEKTLDQIASLKATGMANYFGEQRFGQQQDNVEKALQHLSTARKSKRLTRTRRGIYLSSLRSFLFNQILSLRIKEGFWRQPMKGDVFMLRGSRSIFSSEVNEEILTRFTEMDISSSASLAGRGRSKIEGEAAELEQTIFNQHSEVVDCLERQSVDLQMRPCRIALVDLEVEYNAEQRTITIKTELPSGSYLTTLLDHFVSTRAPEKRDDN